MHNPLMRLAAKAAPTKDAVGKVDPGKVDPGKSVPAKNGATESGTGRAALPFPPGTPPVVSVRDLTKVYAMGDEKIRALNGVCFDLWQGEMVAVMGPSGSGKSTFMNIIGCLDVPTSGIYLLDNIDVSKLNDNQLAAIRGGKIGFVFQNFNLLPRTTALANVELPLIYAGVSRRERRERAIEALSLVGLEGRLKHKPSELSGGQQQRVAIARALVNRPSLILADEPTGNLDTKTSNEIMELFQRLSRERKMTILIITHEPDMAGYCDRAIHIRDGQIVQPGLPAEEN